MSGLRLEGGRGTVLETVPQVRVLVCGGRGFQNKDLLEQTLDRLQYQYGFTDVAHGDAGQVDPQSREVIAGADKLAGEWGKSRGLRVMKFPANWKKYGNSAGPVRNRFMYDTFKPDYVVAFSGGDGTRDMFTYAESQGCKVIYV